MENSKQNWFDNVESRPHPRPGLNWLTTSIYVLDIRKSVDFYKRRMDMVSIFEFSENGDELLFARIRYRGNNFIINKEQWDFDAVSPQTSKVKPPFIFYLYVDDVINLTQRMIEGGSTIIDEPEEQFWGDLKARIKDPFGYYWDLAQVI